MSINFHCACGQRLVVKDEQGGLRVRCPACQNVITVPASPVQEVPVVTPVQQAPVAPPVQRAASPTTQPVDDQTAPWLEQSSAPPPAAPSPQAADENPFQMNKLADPHDDGLPRRSSEWGAGNSTTMAGLGMILVAVVWFVLGLAAGYIYFYPPVLFVLGIVSLIRGLTGNH